MMTMKALRLQPILVTVVVLLVLLQSLCYSVVVVVSANKPNKVNNIANVQDLFSSGSCQDCHRFDGIGGISGGGATSRLLVDYPPEAQSEILDFLFLPNFGASLHILKVEIGGDSQSTDGSESSHMHSQDDLNLHRGYEWWMLKEAKKRNPDILTYGLPWAFPGWIAEDKQNPFQHLDRITNYTLQWVKGARDIHGIELDYLGIWNEKGTNREYLLALRNVLDDHGFQNVKLGSNDGDPENLCPKLINDTEYIDTIDILGFHYPHDDLAAPMWELCNSFQTPIWAAEESSSYDDLNGAACWARVMASHYVLNNMTANIMWNLVGSYMHGTNWYGASMLTAVQPWSGYYEWEQMPVVWATAHYTQFIQPGWFFLPVGHGSGELDTGGYYMTLLSPDLQYFTVIVVKISREHAPCTRPKLWDWETEEETFNLTITLPVRKEDSSSDESTFQVWYSNLESADTILFEKLDPDTSDLTNITATANSPDSGLHSYKISLKVPVGGLFTVTNQANVGQKGEPKIRKTSDPKFPLPYYDDFNSYDCVNCYASYLSDQMGAFEIQNLDNADGDASLQSALVQMAPETPVAWFVSSDRGPFSVIGMTEWEDIHVEVSFRLPKNNTAACISTRTDQHWAQGVSLCVGVSEWHIVYGGGKLNFDPTDIIAQGKVPPSSFGLEGKKWHTMALMTQESQVQAKIDDVLVTEGSIAIRDGDSGFVAIGAIIYSLVEFGHIRISHASNSQWNKPVPESVFAPSSSSPWSVVLRPCTPNGFTSDHERFDITSNWQIKHAKTGLCLQVVEPSDYVLEESSTLTLKECIHDYAPQQFRHDYTKIRNGYMLQSLSNAHGDLCGTRDGRVSLTSTVPNDVHRPEDPPTVACAGEIDAFTKWTLYPNTQQLRNSCGFSPSLQGRAQCLYVEPTGEKSGKIRSGAEAVLS